MDKVYLDTETCGFHGLPVTLQYAINDGPILIHEFWRRPIRESLELIRRICTMEVIGFNLAFDWFHIQKVYNVFSAFPDHDELPEDHIDELGMLEREARDGDCVKPASALDLMLHFRRTELQVTMERDDIRIRRVPDVLAEELAQILTKKIKLDPILFANQKKWAPRFQVEDVKDYESGEVHPSLKNIILRFKPGAGLKSLAKHLLGKKIKTFTEIEVDKRFRPKEYGYAPFARAIGTRGSWNWSWPEVIKYHIRHWAFRADARKYAELDVDFTRQLHGYVSWVPGGDVDSVLACMVASCRWKGYAVDLPKLDPVIENYRKQLNAPQAASHVKDYINEILNPIERVAAWRDGTSKKALESLIKLWGDVNPEAVRRAKAVLAARKARKKIEVLEKLKLAGRFHASFKVIGALSGRMSGTDKLNAQGIDKTKEVRGCFPLAFPGEQLMGGDMQSFEISIAEADYGDPKLRELLTTCDKCDVGMVLSDGRMRCPLCSGLDAKSFHALFGMGFFPELGYDGIMASKGALVGNVYNPIKNAAFATLYGAQPQKIAVTMGISEEQSVEGFHRFWRTFEEAGRKRREVENAFTSLYSEGVGTKIEFKEAEDAIESLLGYKRFFTLENYLIGELYDLTENLPKEWKRLKIKVTRSRKGEQNVGSAVRSALYGCAFGLQASCIRQAANHRIQSTGAGITKVLQGEIWTLQPVGVHRWMVRPMNVHDEIQCPTDPSITGEMETLVRATVEKFRPLIPLIGIDFGHLNSWADK